MVMRRRSHTRGSQRQRGFTYLVLLLAIAILGIGLTLASEVWVTTAKRQKMAELDWIGDQFKQAVGSYYAASPGSVKEYPASLDDLLLDKRYLTIRRHLRTVYTNPFTGNADWEPVLGPGRRVRGVRVRIPTSAGDEIREYIHVPV